MVLERIMPKTPAPHALKRYVFLCPKLCPNYAQNRSITVSSCHFLSTQTSVNMRHRALSGIITNEMLYQLSYVGERTQNY